MTKEQFIQQCKENWYKMNDGEWSGYGEKYIDELLKFFPEEFTPQEARKIIEIHAYKIMVERHGRYWPRGLSASKYYACIVALAGWIDIGLIHE